MWMMPVFRSRVLLVAAALSAALLLLAACEDDGNGGETPAGGDTPTAEATSDGGTPADGGTPVDGETPDDGATDGDDADGRDGVTPDDGAGPDGGNGGDTTADVQMVTGRQFSPNQLTIAAGTDVTISTANTDPGIPHSFAIYNTQQDADGGSDPLAEVATCNGPCEDEVTVNLPGGQYFFRCEVHGSSMSGTLTAR